VLVHQVSFGSSLFVAEYENGCVFALQCIGQWRATLKDVIIPKINEFHRLDVLESKVLEKKEKVIDVNGDEVR
jgi:hypothetical protein